MSKDYVELGYQLYKKHGHLNLSLLQRELKVGRKLARQVVTLVIQRIKDEGE